MMPEPTPGEFTQTVVGAATPVSSRAHASGAQHESLEGRFPPGTLLNGRYRIIALLGRGGMGELYRATDLTLGQSVALKFLPHLASNDPRWLERFPTEVRIAAKSRTPMSIESMASANPMACPSSFVAYAIGDSLVSSAILWQLYLALEPALRARWPKSIVTWNHLLSENLALDAAVYFVVCVGIILGLVRFGLLTTLIAVFTTNAVSRLACSTDLTAWFMPYSYATLLLIASIALFGFWRSLGGQHLVGDDKL